MGEDVVEVTYRISHEEYESHVEALRNGDESIYATREIDRQGNLLLIIASDCLSIHKIGVLMRGSWSIDAPVKITRREEDVVPDEVEDIGDRYDPMKSMGYSKELDWGAMHQAADNLLFSDRW